MSEADVGHPIEHFSNEHLSSILFCKSMIICLLRLCAQADLCFNVKERSVTPPEAETGKQRIQSS